MFGDSPGPLPTEGQDGPHPGGVGDDWCVKDKS